MAGYAAAITHSAKIFSQPLGRLVVMYLRLMESTVATPVTSHAFPFPATAWSRVLRTRGEESDESVPLALDQLCAAYWQPVEGYLRALGCPPQESEDVAQDFFATFLRRDGFQRAEPERGKLRSYLKSAVRHHLFHWRRDRAALRRGGGAEPLTLDGEDSLELPASPAADTQYDEQWALIVMERALDQLKAGYAKRDRLDVYERLKPTLLASDDVDITSLSAELGMTRGALAVEHHRARRRLADLLRTQVAETVDDPAEVDAELMHLLRVLAHQ